MKASTALFASVVAICQVLNHAPKGVTERHYASEHSISDKRIALVKWEAYIQGLLNSGKGTVIQLKSVR